MASALHALLHGIIDYAGMFPPAKLPLEEALAQYLHHRSALEAWMLGRFVCPTDRLQEVSPSSVMPIAALSRGGQTRVEVLSNLRQDLDDIAESRGKSEGKVDVGVLEIRLPPSLYGLDKKRDAAGLFAAVAEMIETSPVPTLQVFYELGVVDSSLHSFVETLAMANAIGGMRKLRRVPGAGMKLRCSGQSPGEFPSSEQVAMVIAECRRNNLRLKFTAGLHHPLRHAAGHGFLNVFIAGVLAHAQGFDKRRITEVLECTDAKEFIFSENELRWRDAVVTSDDIQSARKNLVTSFGSCSFDEPRQGLRALRLLT